MKLSILICSLYDRKAQLGLLLSSLQSQIIQSSEQVLVQTYPDHGKISIGEKRNKLLEQAMGDYICFVDDDDAVSIDYIAKILKALESGPACCSLTGEIHFRNDVTKTFVHSIDYDDWFEKDGIYYRYPNHLNVVKRELALKVGFPHVSHGEDRNYSNRLRPLLKTEAKIDGVIYHYNCKENGT